MVTAVISPVLGAWVVATVAACAGPSSDGPSEEVVPALLPRPGVAHCLADIEIPSDPDVDIEFPDAMSDTGCFDEMAPLVPAPDLVPYQVRSPLWSDGVIKQRFLVIPPGQTIGFTTTGAWNFPDGTSLIKMFTLEAEVGNPDSRRPIETRFMVRARGKWEFFSYMWNDDGTDALRNEQAVTVEYEVRDGGTSERISFDFPSLRGCLACHAKAAGEVLGPRTSQLNREIHYTSGRQNQLLAMRDIGLIDDSLPDDGAFDALPKLVRPDDTAASLEARARSYLHGNCAHCHMPGGYNSTEVDIDLRSELDIADARLCGQPIRHEIFSRDGTLVIDPGNLANSNLYQRMIKDGTSKMPPSGRSTPDPMGQRAGARMDRVSDRMPMTGTAIDWPRDARAADYTDLQPRDGAVMIYPG